MVEQPYQGYMLSWAELAATTAGVSVSIASPDRALQDMLEKETKAKGAHVVTSAISLDDAITKGMILVDRIVARSIRGWR